MKTMKNIFLGFFTVAFLAGCKKEATPKKDYFSCKIDGRHFEPQLGGGTGCTSQVIDYYPKGSINIHPGFFAMSGADCSTDDNELIAVNITVLNPNVYQYSFKSDSVNGTYSPKVFEYKDSTLSGEIHFSTLIPPKYDDKGFISETGQVEGTFYFTLAEPDGTTIEITEGRFGFLKIPQY